MKRLMIIILAVLLMSPAASLAAQRTIDIQALGDELIGTDSERLLMRLNNPIPDTLLGDAFDSARPLAAGLIAEQRAFFDEALEGLTGTAIYTVDYTPSVSEASPAAGSPGASPEARGTQVVFSSATLSYLLFAEPVDTSDMDAFGATIQQAMGSEAMAGDVEQISVSDGPAVLISSVAIVNAVEFHTQWIAVPIGNLVVVSMVIEGSEPFDPAAFRADNESLALSGITWLDAILNG